MAPNVGTSTEGVNSKNVCRSQTEIARLKEPNVGTFTEGVYGKNFQRNWTEIAPFFNGKEPVGTFIFKSVEWTQNGQKRPYFFGWPKMIYTY